MPRHILIPALSQAAHPNAGACKHVRKLPTPKMSSMMVHCFKQGVIKILLSLLLSLLLGALFLGLSSRLLFPLSAESLFPVLFAVLQARVCVSVRAHCDRLYCHSHNN